MENATDLPKHIIRVVEPVYLYTFLIILTACSLFSTIYLKLVVEELRHNHEVEEIIVEVPVECDSVQNHATEEFSIGKPKVR